MRQGQGAAVQCPCFIVGLRRKKICLNASFDPGIS